MSEKLIPELVLVVNPGLLGQDHFGLVIGEAGRGELDPDHKPVGVGINDE